MRAVLQAFEKPDCEIPTFHSTYVGNYMAQPEDGQLWLLNHTVISITLEIDNQAVVDWYNNPSNDGCGLDSWELNVPKKIEGRLCKPVQFPEAGETLFDKVSVSSGELRFGHFPLTWSAKSESERPEMADGVAFGRASE